MSLSEFWKVIDDQIEELKSAKTADDVLRILANDRDPNGYGGGGSDGFFAGSGGDDGVDDALSAAGWRFVGGDRYHYTMKAPNGDKIRYCEGDIYRM